MNKKQTMKTWVSFIHVHISFVVVFVLLCQQILHNQQFYTISNFTLLILWSVLQKLEPPSFLPVDDAILDSSYISPVLSPDRAPSRA